LRSLKVPQQPRRKTQLMHGLMNFGQNMKRAAQILSKDAIREIRKRLKRAARQVRLKTVATP